MATSSSDRVIGLNQVSNPRGVDLEPVEQLRRDRTRQERGPHGAPLLDRRDQRAVLVPRPRASP